MTRDLPRGHLGSFGAHVGALGGHLGAVLEAMRAIFGGHRGRLGAILRSWKVILRSRQSDPSYRKGKWAPEANLCKNISFYDVFYVWTAILSLRKAILGPSWGHLEAISGHLGAMLDPGPSQTQNTL